MGCSYFGYYYERLNHTREDTKQGREDGVPVGSVNRALSQVAYLLVAGNIQGSPPRRLRRMKQPVRSLRKGFSRPQSTRVTGSQVHLSPCLMIRIVAHPLLAFRTP